LVVTDATEGDGVPDSSVAAQKLLHRARKFGLGTCPMDLFRPPLNRARAKKQFRVPSEWPCARPTAGALAEGETLADLS
jgi:nitroreductase